MALDMNSFDTITKEMFIKVPNPYQDFAKILDEAGIEYKIIDSKVTADKNLLFLLRNDGYHPSSKGIAFNAKNGKHIELFSLKLRKDHLGNTYKTWVNGQYQKCYSGRGKTIMVFMHEWCGI